MYMSKAQVIYTLMDKFWKNVKKGDDKLHATQTEPENIERVYDIPYIDDNNSYHLLDVYYPEGTKENLPVIIDIHGGGWMYADKNLNRNYCLNLAKRGFTVFNVSYRLVPDVTVNEQLKDVACALKWINDNMGNYPCDRQNIMLTGDSAGGMLAVYSALILSSPVLRQLFDTVDTGMKLTTLLLTSPVSYMNESGIMGVYTKVMWGEDYRFKDTYNYMNVDDILDHGVLPPTFLLTSSGDFMALKQTRKLYSQLQERGITSKLMDFPKFEGKNLPHVFSVLEPESKPGVIAIDTAIRFYRKCIDAKVASE